MATNGVVGIIANPVSGRDIRRVAARGAVSTTEDKRNRIARAVIGAVTAGATRIVAMAEPFGIATGALTDLRIEADIEIVDVAATVSPADTVRAVEAMRLREVGSLITLGGDGTNRTVAKVWPEATLVPMSTGTNNVFPSLTEPTVAGAAAGLVACGIVDADACAPRSKMIEVRLADGSTDIALIDAVTLADDFVGNRMPADGNLLRQVLVSRSHPSKHRPQLAGRAAAPVRTRWRTPRSSSSAAQGGVRCGRLSRRGCTARCRCWSTHCVDLETTGQAARPCRAVLRRRPRTCHRRRCSGDGSCSPQRTPRRERRPGTRARRRSRRVRHRQRSNRQPRAQRAWARSTTTAPTAPRFAIAAERLPTVQSGPAATSSANS